MTTDERARWGAPAAATGRTVLCLALACLAFGLASCRERPAGGSSVLTIAVVPKGATHEHWKRVHVGAEKAAAEFRAKGVRRAGRLEGATPRGRPRAAGAGRRGLREPAASAGWSSRRSTARRWCGRSRRPQGRDPHGHLRFGPGSTAPGRELRRHRQREGRAARRSAHGRAPGRQGHGADAPLPGGIGGHRGPRARLPGGAEGHPSRRRGHLVGSVRGGHARHRQAHLREPAEPLRRGIDGIFTPNESSTAGMLLALQDIGKRGEDHVRRLRLQRRLHRAAAQGRAGRVRRAEPREHGVPRA